MFTYIIAGFIALLMVLAVVKIVKDRKKGNCSCGCSGCSMQGSCHKQ